MDISQSKFMIAGIKKSGYHSAKLLLNNAKQVIIYDENQEIRKSKEYLELVSLGAKESVNIEDGEKSSDVLLISPAVPIDSEICNNFRREKKRIIGEVEFASMFIKEPIIAVTGTNGKTTTCSILDHILKESGKNSRLCGNIGTPITSILDKIQKGDKIVAEISSYQLETTLRFCPHVAIILNITPDHLSRHYTFENYVYIKSKIIMNMSESEYAVLNYDDEVVRNFKTGTRGKVVWFSTKEKVDGAYVLNDKIYYYDEEIMDVSNLSLKGEHNLYNVLATICALKITNIPTIHIVNGLASFKGVKHRIQLVKTVNEVDYYNDSKGTNMDATLKAIESIDKPKILILGGYNKGLDYKEMFNKIKQNTTIKRIILTGATSKIMYDECYYSSINNVCIIPKFIEAVKFSKIIASSGDAVLLSPATSSFDEFSSYEERGDKFIEIVEEF